MPGFADWKPDKVVASVAQIKGESMGPQSSSNKVCHLDSDKELANRSRFADPLNCKLHNDP